MQRILDGTALRMALVALVLLAATLPVRAEAISPAELHPLHGKRLIAFGWDSPNTLYLRENLEVFERSGYQGVVINVCHDPRLPNRVDTRRGEERFRLADRVFVPQRLELEDWRWVIDDLQQCAFRNLTDNFLLVHAIPAQVDFCDADFDAAVHNIGVMATIAREAGLTGLFFDVESYSGLSLFYYPDRPHADQRSFEEYQQHARDRGREWMAAACEAFPEITLLCVWCNSSSVHYMSGGTALQETGYGLLPAFVDGMLEGKTDAARIVDGFEFSYPYRSERDFLSAYHTIRDVGRRLSSVPRLYDAGIEAGFGVWLDHRSKEWSTEDFSANYHSPQSLQQTLTAALGLADRYVWVWAERAKRWYGDTYPEAYREATIAATAGASAVQASAPPDDARVLVRLPLEWRFITDPDNAGLSAGYFRPDFDDSEWRTLSVDRAWEEQGVDYDGVAWYRVRFTAQELPQNVTLLLSFGAVDESAWVYVNGQLAGQHDIGEAGWDRPFAVDVTDALREGENVVAVRVLDRVLAGGIWRPVELLAAD